MNTGCELRNTHGRLRLQPNSGMIGPAKFNLPELGIINPLTCPKWGNRGGAEDWLPLIRNLCGDFICAPYGAPGTSDALPAHWRKGAAQNIFADDYFHGLAANALWQVELDPEDPSLGYMVFIPPEPHPFERISRHVSLLPDAPGYQVELTILARHNTTFPLSLHPCFELPAQPGALRLEIANTRSGWTYPLAVVPDHAPIAVDARFDNLNAVPRVNGGTIDLTRLPPRERCEALIQIPTSDGRVRLVYEDAGYAVNFSYDADLLQSLVIWVSNQGRDEAPFDGNFRTLGLEAVAGAFDLGPAVSASPNNPIASEGVSTAIELSAGQILTTRSTIEIEAI